MTTSHSPDLLARIAALAEPAPPGLRPDVLVTVGLADRYAPISTPLGRLNVAWNGRGVSWLGSGDPSAFEAGFGRSIGRPLEAVDRVPPPLGAAIERRIDGDRRVRIEVDLRGRTPFEVAVLRKALEIPRGEVRPYAWVAAEIGRPRAVRAVGSALAHNPVPLVVPCHRVVRSDGSIGQYSLGGPDSKLRMLTFEGLAPLDLEASGRAGERFVGSDTTRIVCLPSCHNARRIGARHRVPFRSLAEARSAGYRPCRECRPASGAFVA